MDYQKYGLGGKPDYSGLSNIKTNKQKEEEKKAQIIEEDIASINSAIESNDGDRLLEIHENIDAKYHAYIPGWGRSSYCYSPEFGFDYSVLESGDTDALTHNLKMMSGMLDNYKNGFTVPEKVPEKAVNVSVSNTNENHNNIDIHISFEQAKQQFEEMAGLDQAATEELIKKVDELENIYKEKTSKKKKWEKVKPILHFAIDKSADIATMIMSLVLQMKLGI